MGLAIVRTIVEAHHGRFLPRTSRRAARFSRSGCRLPRPINFGLIRAAAPLLRRSNRRVGFLDLDQRTTVPRTDPCRDEPKEGVMFRCGKILIALAMLMAIPVAVSAQTADKPPAPSGQAQPASQPPPSCRAFEARATRGAGCADRALSRRTARQCAGGIDLSARSRAGRSLAEGAQEPEGRCAEDRGRQAGLGRQRQGAGQHAQTFSP